MDDAGLPDEKEFRACMHDYMRWSVDRFLLYGERDAVIPDGEPMPRWGWDGPGSG
jgi:hypothetical protein